VIASDAKGAVARSAARYIAALEGESEHGLTSAGSDPVGA